MQFTFFFLEKLKQKLKFENNIHVIYIFKILTFS